MPYLNWEYSSKRKAVMNIVKDSERRPLQSMDFNIDSEPISLRNTDFRKGQRPENRTTILGKYLLQIASLSNIMDEYIDELALRKEIYLKSNIQLRRTLPQSNSWASDRFGDEDQAIYRGTRARSDRGKLLVVDQLWMWILDESEMTTVLSRKARLIIVDTVITSFPSRYGARRSITTRGWCSGSRISCIGCVYTSKERRRRSGELVRLDTGCATLGLSHVTMTSQYPPFNCKSSPNSKVPNS
jgi:hypothetical protein